METDYDVVIIGGALAGASMGLLLRRERPDARVLIVERSTAFDFKVGESTSEIAGAFLTRVLRIGSWLSREQIAKNGLRFWFTSPGNDCLGRCAEIGPKLQVRLPAYQLDRAKLDTHVLDLARQSGCEVRRPAVIRNLELNGVGANRATLTENGIETSITAKWIVDASGRAAVIARHRGTLQNLSDHPTASLWCRFTGVADLDAHELIEKHPGLARRVWSQRSTATNHLTGDGWWAWIIPLQGGEVSVGITWDRRIFEMPTAGSIPDRLRGVLMEHPVGKYLMEHAVAVEEDARSYGTVAYQNTEVTGDGWATVGDSSGFMDPLYSHGIDFIGNTVWAVSRLILDSLSGNDVSEKVAAYDVNYRESYSRWFRALYKDKYYYLGDAELMNAAVLLDVACYFVGPVRMVWADHQKELCSLPYGGPIGSAFGKFMAFYNRRFVHLAAKRRANGTFGRRNVDHQFIFRDSFQPSFAVRNLLFDGLKAWARLEVSALFARRPATDPAATPAAPKPVMPPTAAAAAPATAYHSAPAPLPASPAMPLSVP
ncbi:MAG: electron transfer flavoprotein [Verrucomicrobiales bacterium]|nr:electron transfer flavoprotein [Verrucomicrobiales bacterium]